MDQLISTLTGMAIAFAVVMKMKTAAMRATSLVETGCILFELWRGRRGQKNVQSGR